MKNNNDHNAGYGIPPDGEPSEALLSAIKYYSESGKPLLYLARMRRVSYGYIIHIKSLYLK
jgi:hypothetical protein